MMNGEHSSNMVKHWSIWLLFGTEVLCWISLLNKEKVTASWLDWGAASKLLPISSHAKEIWLSRPAHVWGPTPSFPLLKKKKIGLCQNVNAMTQKSWKGNYGWRLCTYFFFPKSVGKTSWVSSSYVDRTNQTEFCQNKELGWFPR